MVVLPRMDQPGIKAQQQQQFMGLPPTTTEVIREQFDDIGDDDFDADLLENLDLIDELLEQDRESKTPTATNPTNTVSKNDLTSTIAKANDSSQIKERFSTRRKNSQSVDDDGFCGLLDEGEKITPLAKRMGSLEVDGPSSQPNFIQPWDNNLTRGQ